MVWLGKQGGVFKVGQVLVEHCLLEQRGKVRGETRGSTTRGDMLTVGPGRARVTWKERGGVGGGGGGGSWGEGERGYALCIFFLLDCNNSSYLYRLGGPMSQNTHQSASC